jgi:hypothetical protein
VLVNTKELKEIITRMGVSIELAVKIRQRRRMLKNKQLDRMF